MSTKPEAQKKVQNTKKVATPKNGQSPATEKTLTKIDSILRPTAQGRIKRLENFQMLAKRHGALMDKKDELDKFIISSDGTKEKIVLENAEGFKMQVSNSQVIEKIVDLIQNELTNFIQKSEKEVLSFNI